VAAPVSLLDVGPTVLDLADISSEPYDLTGQSLRPYLEGEGDPDRAIPTFLNDNVAIRKGDYRLIRYEDGSTQFYNVKEDMWQQKDLGQSHPAFLDMYQHLISCCYVHGLNLVT
jgi:arylsulfatase A-like enzyme